MPRRETRDTGLREHVVEIFGPSDAPRDASARLEAFDRWAASIPTAKPGDLTGEALRRENAERCRRILAAAGMPSEPPFDWRAFRAQGLAEDSAAWIAAEWLRAYIGLEKNLSLLEERPLAPDALADALLCAEDLGRLQERMWWRAGVDPATGKRREKLALGKRAQELARDRATAARRAQASEDEPEWWDRARHRAQEIRRQHPSHARTRVAKVIADELRRSPRQVQDVIKPLWS